MFGTSKPLRRAPWLQPSVGTVNAAGFGHLYGGRLVLHFVLVINATWNIYWFHFISLRQWSTIVSKNVALHTYYSCIVSAFTNIYTYTNRPEISTREWPNLRYAAKQSIIKPLCQPCLSAIFLFKCRTGDAAQFTQKKTQVPYRDWSYRGSRTQRATSARLGAGTTVCLVDFQL